MNLARKRTKQDDIIEKILGVLSPTQAKSMAVIANEIQLPVDTVARYLKLMKRIQDGPQFEMLQTVNGYQVKIIPGEPPKNLKEK